MTKKGRVLGLLPPLLAGLAAAIAVEVSAGLLLYTDEGMLPALTLILTLETGALGLGLWSGPLPVGGGVVEQVRRRWLFCLLVFALAAALSAGLSFVGDLPASGIGQGVGLGFLGGLPLFSIGSLLGAMSRPDGFGRPSATPVGAPSVFGAAVGFLLAGSILLPNAAPHTLYLFCLVVLSGGALLQGWVLDGRRVVEIKETVSTASGEFRVEERASGSPRRELKVLLKGGRVRGAEDMEGNPGRDWEAAVLEGLDGKGRRPESVLFLGGGSGTLVRILFQRFPQTRIHVVERSPELVTLARAHFAQWDGWEELSLEIGDPLATALGSQRPFSLIVVDCGALPTLGGVPFLREPDWRILVDMVDTGGVLVMGGLQSHQGDVAVPIWEVMRDGRKWFDQLFLYQKELPPHPANLLREAGDGAECLLLFSTSGAAAWPPFLSGFQLRPAEGG